MVLGDEFQDFIFSQYWLTLQYTRDVGRTISLDNFALRIRHIVNPASVDLVPGPEQALPARDGVGANHRVRGSEVKACVLRRAAVLVNELEVVFGGYLVEVGLGSH